MQLRSVPTVRQAGEVRVRRLESIRALAALAVLESHAWGWHTGYGRRTVDTFFHRAFISGDFGVNVFFTLTGLQRDAQQLREGCLRRHALAEAADV